MNTENNLTAFLIQFRRSAEIFWQNAPERPISYFQQAGVGGTSWQQGTCWKPGLSSEDIRDIEAGFDLQFPEEYYQLLRVLNTTNKGYRAFGLRGNKLQQCADRPIFYDWQNGQGDISDAWEATLEGLMFDVQYNSLWLESWGAKPETSEAQQAQLAKLIKAAPALLPVSGHRYMISYPLSEGCPVISVWQSDIIIYGVNLQHYLQQDFGPLCKDVAGRFVSQQMQNNVFNEAKAIPFWGELIC